MLAISTAGLTGCGSLPSVKALQGVSPSLPTRVHLARTPFVGQDDTLCGPAVLAMTLAAARRPVDLSVLTPQVYLPARRGSLQAEMLGTARRHGLLAMTVPGGLAGAFSELAAGRPVALLVNLALPWWPRWHYLVLTGYDLASEEVRVHSGLQRDAVWTLTTLDSVWARSGHWGFVVPAPGQLPATATEASTLRALLALERSAQAADTAPTWSAAADRWPMNLTLAIGEANSWLDAGEARKAEQRLSLAAERLDRAAAWNNLAQLRILIGDRSGALLAAHRAVARAESAEPHWRDAARRTLAMVASP